MLKDYLTFSRARYKTAERRVIVGRVNWAIASRGGVYCTRKLNPRNIFRPMNFSLTKEEQEAEAEECEQYEFPTRGRSSAIKRKIFQSYLTFKSNVETPLTCSSMNLKVLGHGQSAANSLLVAHLLEIVKNLILEKSKPNHVETFCIGYSMGCMKRIYYFLIHYRDIYIHIYIYI